MNLTNYEQEKLQKFLLSIISKCDQILHQKLETIWKSELEKIKTKISCKDEKKAPLLATNLVKEKLPGIIKQHENEIKENE